jgi:hypothetical protein
MSAPESLPIVDLDELTVVPTAVSVTVSVVVGDQSKTFTVGGATGENADPFRLAQGLLSAARGDVDAWLDAREWAVGLAGVSAVIFPSVSPGQAFSGPARTVVRDVR